MVSDRASSAFWEIRFQTVVRPSRKQADWSAVRNSTWPLSAVTRCLMMTQDAAQFSGAFSVGSGRASPACFTGRWLNPLPGAPSPTP